MVVVSDVLARRTAGRCQVCYGRMTDVGETTHPSCEDSLEALTIRRSYERWRLGIFGRPLEDPR